MNKTTASAGSVRRIVSQFFLLIFLLSPGLRAAERPVPRTAPPNASMEQLWVKPEKISSLDLFYGPGGEQSAPDSAAAYTFKKYESSGHSKGYDVKDPSGRTWKVKVGVEAQAEIVVSRILWAIGYHQPVLHYLPHWEMKGGPSNQGRPGRFRLESGHDKVGEWEWDKIPLAGTRPWRGLIIANLLLNNWDLSTSNNRIYQAKGTETKGPRTWYVNQDVGGSLGRTRWPIGTRNNIDDFESQEFVKSVEDGHVVLDYHARHRDLLKEITPDDVAWTCRLLSEITDRQLHDAFRAGGYSPEISERYIRKIKQKINEGLELEARGRGAQ